MGMLPRIEKNIRKANANLSRRLQRPRVIAVREYGAGTLHCGVERSGDTDLNPLEPTREHTPILRFEQKMDVRLAQVSDILSNTKRRMHGITRSVSGPCKMRHSTRRFLAARARARTTPRSNPQLQIELL